MAIPKLHKSKKFGTFSGVFIPSILTIFGPIMFMRFNFVIGNIGVWNTLIILAVAQTISLCTAFSLSAISTNTKVHEGGAYFLISRSLGSSFGGAIGFTLFWAQALSVPFYIIGFSEALVNTFPFLSNYYLYIAVGTGLVLFYLAWIGADWALKAQSIIFVLLMTAIFVFLAGAALKFNIPNLEANYNSTSSANIYVMFAIFFPAVTGIMAGVNMSGDLKNPGRSLALGTFAAVIFSTIIYGVEIFLCAGAYSRDSLISFPYRVLVDGAALGLGFLVVAGVFSATISSAIGSYLGAPRILRAISRDKIFPGIKIFSREKRNSEPKKALILTTVITVAVLVWAGFNVGQDSSRDPLNVVAKIVTMFFLYTYGMVNMAAFVESFGGNPSFRPRFKYYHWSISLAGIIACIVVSFLIDSPAAVVALVIFAFIYWVARKREMRQTFGDARRGFLFSRMRDLLIRLTNMPNKAKNWRPTIAVLTGRLIESTERLNMLKFAIYFEGGKGIVSVVEIIEGDFEKLNGERLGREKDMKDLLKKEELFAAFAEVMVAKDFDSGLSALLQTHSIGPLKPNIIMMGCPRFEERKVPFVRHLRMVGNLGKSFVIFKSNIDTLPESPSGEFIDVWWRGRQNGSLMFILAYLLQSNMYWKHLKIRVIRTIQDDSEYNKAFSDINNLITSSRIDAEPKILLSKDYKKSLHETSSKSAAVFLGAYIPEEERTAGLFSYIDSVSVNMPPIFFIYSSGDADLTA